MAGRLDGLLDPYHFTPLFVCFPLLDAPTLAPVPSTHYWKQVYFLVWRNLPSAVASSGTLKGINIYGMGMNLYKFRFLDGCPVGSGTKLKFHESIFKMVSFIILSLGQHDSLHANQNRNQS
jgi:hypothetical protein